MGKHPTYQHAMALSSDDVTRRAGEPVAQTEHPCEPLAGHGGRAMIDQNQMPWSRSSGPEGIRDVRQV